VTAWANWRRVIPLLAKEFRVVAPDVVGFGFTERPQAVQYGIKLWVSHLLGFLDALGLDKVSVIGNSFGGGLALAAVARHPERFERLVLMGTPAGTFAQTAGLRSAWSYEPSLDNMERMLRMFPYDPACVTARMVRERYETSLLHGGQEAFRRLIPPPGPEGETTWVKGVAEESLREIRQAVLVLHGREDSVVPPDCGMLIHRNVVNSQLHMFGRCGHWVQVEMESAFIRQVGEFLREPVDARLSA
jgi:2-hydroxy-6-oxo-octa-2,4-dienoate hydrolase